ncbi:MAG TPA: hypothetical protein H9869_08015 [Candidatus Ligilactobacillus excrementipullorum]|nr:hypothetical protein [Candidatus Ligilactobacillus excrementipullorum]
MMITKKDSIQQLINIIDNQNSWYVGVMLALVGAIIALVIAFIGFQWYLSSKQAQKIENKTLNKVEQMYVKKLEKELLDQKESNIKQMKLFSDAIIDDIAQKLDYLSHLDNDDVTEIRFVTETIRQKVSIIYDLNKSTDDLNKYLHKIVGEVDKAYGYIGQINNSNDVIWEGLHMIRKGITFNILWDDDYKEPDESPQE